MVYAFRPSASIAADNAQAKLSRLRDQWMSSRETWFDGSPDSVDRRIAQVDEVIAFASRTGPSLINTKVGMTCLAMLPQLTADRTELLAMRDRLAGFEGDMWAPWREHFDMTPNQKAEWGGPQGHGKGLVVPGGDNGFQDLPPEGMAVHRAPGGRERILDPAGEERFALRQAALDFIASEDTSDRNELLVRAERLVEAQTSTWSADASARTVHAFVTAVGDQIPRVQQTARQASAEQFADFEDHLMFG